MGSTTIDVDEVEKSLKQEFEALRPLLDECSIYRVPERLRRLNKNAYTPQIVSIGPLHHGRKELQAFEEHKKRYLQDFLQRTQVSMKEFLIAISSRANKICDCYAEPISLNSSDFAKLVLADAAFLLEYLLRRSFRDLRKHNDPVFNRWSIIDVTRDLWKLENQLPFFILQELFDLARINTSFTNEIVTMNTLIKKFSTSVILLALSIEVKFEENIFSKAEHFVDAIKICLHPSNSGTKKELNTLKAPSATELHQAGVKFVAASSKNLLEINFHEGVLEIPHLTMTKPVEPLLLNVMAFEQRRSPHIYVTDYVNLMKLLVISPKDMDLLVGNGIIENWLSGGEEVSAFFQNLSKETPTVVEDFYFANVVDDLNSYFKDPRHWWKKWKITLEEEYFRTPWTVISVIAASILLLLTFIQAVCSVLQVL